MVLGSESKMAESKGLVFAKTVQKHAGRAKEKILQKVGKVDRTADEIFDDNVQCFNKQQNAANKLQKELNNYIRCVKAMQTASKTLYDCISEVYEPEWTGHDLMTVQSQNIEILCQDLGHKLTDQVLIPLNTYQGQFPEMRKKIEKRGRKLVDYDSQRHTFQALQTSKKREEVKIARAKEQLEEAKRTFALFNAELNEELPALYESRVLFFITNLQTLFSAEQVFHTELAKVHSELESIIEKLAKESSQRTSAHNRRGSPQVQAAAPRSPVLLTSPASDKGSRRSLEADEAASGAAAAAAASAAAAVPAAAAAAAAAAAVVVDDESAAEPAAQATGEGLKDYEPVDVGAQVEPSPSARANHTTNGTAAVNDVGSPTDAAGSRRVEDLYDIPIGATTENLPPGVLYRVRATYKYTAEDDDELALEVGDIVQVVEYEDPEELEEGWLMGIKESTGRKGLFPANFTRPI